MKVKGTLARWCCGVIAAACVALSPAAYADINVGVILSLTGPGASLGIPSNETVQLWGNEIAGQPLKITVLNDGTDATTATSAARRLIQEANVDIIIGPGYTPNSLAVIPLIAEGRVAAISLAGGGAIVEPLDANRKWSFKLTPTETVATTLLFDHMRKSGVKTVGLFALGNAYGEGFLKVADKLAADRGLQIVGTERYGITDQSVMSQALKMMAAKPDAVFIIGPGTPAALPHVTLVQRGYKGAVYQTQGAANNDFLRVGGKDLEGAYVAVAPMLVAEQLPQNDPIRAVAMEYVTRFEGKHGVGSRSVFGASAWDALTLLQAALPAALKKAKPGTPEFRVALRDAIEGLRNAVGTSAVYNMGPTDHNGVDARSQVLVRIEGGKWKLVH